MSRSPPEPMLRPVTPDPPDGLVHARLVEADLGAPYEIEDTQGTTRSGMGYREQATDDADEVSKDSSIYRTEPSGLPIQHEIGETTCVTPTSTVGRPRGPTKRANPVIRLAVRVDDPGLVTSEATPPPLPWVHVLYLGRCPTQLFVLWSDAAPQSGGPQPPPPPKWSVRARLCRIVGVGVPRQDLYYCAALFFR